MSILTDKLRRTVALAGLPLSVQRVIRKVRRERLTYLSTGKLISLAWLCRSLDRRHIEGVIVETGCALGGSALVVAAAKSPARPLAIYDVFAMIPPPSDNDGADVAKRYDLIRSGRSPGIGGDTYYGYQSNLYEKVRDTFERAGYPPVEHHVSLVKGMIEDTLHVEGPVALAHIDLDWYEPVLTSLERIVPHLSAGGVIVLDDYLDWSGCRKATDQYFDSRRDAFTFDLSSGAMVIRKSGPGDVAGSEA